MKQVKRVAAVVLAICMLASLSVFAAAPSATIVSPAENAIIASDELLVSVKVADKKKISVTVFEEKLVSLDKDDKPVLDKDGKEILLSFDVKDIKKEDFKDIKKLYEDEAFTEVALAEPAVYTAVGEAGYFTKTIEKMSSGLYRVQVDVLDKDGKVTESVSSFVALQEKPAESKAEKNDKTETKAVTVEAQKANVVQSLVKLIKSIIK